MPAKKKRSRRSHRGPNFEAAWLRLNAWARRAEIDLHLRPQPSVSLPYMRCASINIRVGPATRVYEALHELGHILAGDECSTLGLEVKEGRRPPPRTYAFRAARVAEEYDAWVRGWVLGKRLRFGLDYRDYWRVASRALATYTRWSAEPYHRRE